MVSTQGLLRRPLVKKRKHSGVIHVIDEEPESEKGFQVYRTVLYAILVTPPSCHVKHYLDGTREVLQAEIESRLTLRQSDILPQTHQRNFLRIPFLHIRYWVPESSIHVKSYAFQPKREPANSPLECSTLEAEAYIRMWLGVWIYQSVIFWVVDICDMNVVGEKCVWLQNKERIDTHNNTVMML